MPRKGIFSGGVLASVWTHWSSGTFLAIQSLLHLEVRKWAFIPRNQSLMGYRSCQGLLQLSESWGKVALPLQVLRWGLLGVAEGWEPRTCKGICRNWVECLHHLKFPWQLKAPKVWTAVVLLIYLQERIFCSLSLVPELAMLGSFFFHLYLINVATVTYTQMISLVSHLFLSKGLIINEELRTPLFMLGHGSVCRSILVINEQLIVFYVMSPVLNGLTINFADFLKGSKPLAIS